MNTSQEEIGESNTLGLRASGFIKTAAGILLSVILFTWILQVANLRNVLHVLLDLPLLLVLATILVGYFSIPLRVIQWQWLLGNPPTLTFRVTLRALCLGYLGNCLLPMRGGELLKVYVLARSSGLHFTKVLASVVLARLQDLLPILILAAAVFLVIPVQGGIQLDAQGFLPSDISVTEDQLRMAFHTFTLIVLAAAVAVVVAYAARDTVRVYTAHLLRRLLPTLADRVDRIFLQLNDGLSVVGKARYFAGSQVAAFLCWALFTLAPIPLLTAFGLDLRHACLTAVAVNGLATFAHLLPSAPGAVGTFHALCLVALLLVNPGMNRDAAIAYTLVAHLIGVVSPTLPGLVFLPGAWGHIRAVKKETVTTSGVPSHQ